MRGGWGDEGGSLSLIREAIEHYVEALEEDGQPVPAPQANELVEVYRNSPAGRRTSSIL